MQPGFPHLPIQEQRYHPVFSFDGLSLGSPPPAKWKVRRDGGQFDQFSGATITPRAVVATIKRGLEFFERNKAEILSADKTTKETG